MHSRFCLFALGALVITTGCAHPRTAEEISKAGGLTAANAKAKTDAGGKPAFTPAAKTSVVGTVAWLSPVDSIGVIQLNRDPFPAGAFLMTRDANLKPTGILQTTGTVRGRTQGVTLINGVPMSQDEVIEPGPDMAPIIEYNFDRNRRHEASEIMKAAGTATPEIVPGM